MHVRYQSPSWKNHFHCYCSCVCVLEFHSKKNKLPFRDNTIGLIIATVFFGFVFFSIYLNSTHKKRMRCESHQPTNSKEKKKEKKKCSCRWLGLTFKPCIFSYGNVFAYCFASLFNIKKTRCHFFDAFYYVASGAFIWFSYFHIDYTAMTCLCSLSLSPPLSHAYDVRCINWKNKLNIGFSVFSSLRLLTLSQTVATCLDDDKPLPFNFVSLFR